MKVLPFKIPKPKRDALIFQIDKGQTFYDKLHQHEEIQLSFIVEGTGTLIVGDTVNYYTKDDVFIIGSHLPHVFKSDVHTSFSQMFSLFFTKRSFGSEFFYLEELQELQPFFKRARHGFKITSGQNEVKELFLSLEKASGFNRFSILLQLLKVASDANYKSLSSFVYDKKYSDLEGYRMQNIFAYTMSHFTTPISLHSIAQVANMTPNAFCKYFKKRTNKTYMQFLNELRIEHACKLLLSQTDLPIAEIADRSGFNNISNFNRCFKSLKNCSPSGYKSG